MILALLSTLQMLAYGKLYYWLLHRYEKTLSGLPKNREMAESQMPTPSEGA
jgi:hypothetical protein